MKVKEYERPKYGEIRHKGEYTVIPEGYDYVQLKMDGMYGNLTIDKGEWSITSRTGKIKASGVWPRKRDKYHLTGEFMKGSHWAKRNGIEENNFYTFDCLWYGDRDISEKDYYMRQKYMARAVDTLTDITYTEVDWVAENFNLTKVKTHYVDKWPTLWRQYVEDRGYEGLIFKNSSKTSDMVRMKKVVEMDYICVGFEPADETSKYKGLVGAVKGTLIDKDVIVECGGLTDEQRHEYTTNAENYIGQIFTAKGNDWFPSGSIRHPKFREWRDDKTHYECSYNQVPNDIRIDD